MRIAGIVLTSIGALGGIMLVAEGDFYSAILGGGVLFAVGIIMIIKGKSRKEIAQIKAAKRIEQEKRQEEYRKVKAEKQKIEAEARKERELIREKSKAEKQRLKLEAKKNRAEAERLKAELRKEQEHNHEKERENLLALQKIVLLNGPDELILSKSQLQENAEMRAEQSIKIVQDCVNLINNTANPDVYFKRYEMLKHHMHILERLEPYVKFFGELPSVSLNKMNKDEQISIKCFIDRYYDSVGMKVGKLRTEDAKLNHIQRFHDKLEEHFGIMNQENINYVNDLYNTAFNTVFCEYH
jgi:flagellar biosynthesis GTPase FlhF|nr:MAG TPA: cell envelope integrity inner membrane protein [Caudoviricetes sp.]